MNAAAQMQIQPKFGDSVELLAAGREVVILDKLSNGRRSVIGRTAGIAGCGAGWQVLPMNCRGRMIECLEAAV